MTALVGDIVEDALSLIGEVAGPGVQQYSEDRMLKEAVRGFNLLFKKYHWHQYREWFRLQLDGSLGMVSTNDLEVVKDFEDFFGIYRDGQRAPLSVLSRNVNPYALTSTGAQAQYWTSLNVRSAYYTEKRLQFYPITATEYVNIGARVYPVLTADTWTVDDTMDLDKDMLVNACAFATLVGDDLNTGAADMLKQLMEMRFRDIVAGFSDQAIAISGGGGIPLNWQNG